MSASVPSEDGLETSEEQHRPVFVTTHWSVVLSAAGGEPPNAQAALESLCRTYWYRSTPTHAGEDFPCKMLRI